MIFDDATVRGFCLALAKTVPYQEIRPLGTPYLDRYFLAGWSPLKPVPGPAVFLHHFVASDPRDEVHSHPWVWGASIILAGGYREFRCIGTRTSVQTFQPGDVNILQADDRHRIELLGDDCWSLFLAGEYQQPWRRDATC